MPDETKDARPISEEHKPNRALTYTEMMNEGRQNISASNHPQGENLQKRVEELERKVEHLQKIIQRQLRLDRMVK
ncbi:hypothetical protein [Synechococcus sp. UW179A]|uniref:hypothetical protein n=1 Tax=Synechococcus sp. UW179A TaxID=2575510 RepID=UPI000E0F543C|nr:hypothetical protein [Synechococcus sp. UW179A]